MFVAKVTGSLVSTQKVEAMKGCKLLVVEPYRVDPAERRQPQRIVLDHFGKNTAQPAEDHRPKGRIVLHAENDFDIMRYKLVDAYREIAF